MVFAVVAVAALAAGGGLLALHASRFGSDPSRPSAEPVVAAFLGHWRSGDYARMYALLAPSQRARMSLQAFTSAYTHDDTVAGVMAIRPSNRFQAFRGHLVTTVAVRTRKFGWLVNPLSVPVVIVRKRFYVLWSSALAFPGLQPGGRLVRRVAAPETPEIGRAHV